MVNFLNKKLLLIVNPVAGTKKINRHFADILIILTDAGYECQVQMTTKEFGAKDWVVRCGKDKDLIVCSGGDGTLNDVVAGCLEIGIKPNIGYIPCGSTNDFANGIGMSLHPIDATEDIVVGKENYIDAGSFNGRTFIYTASFGAFTKASYNAPREMKNSLGYLAYILEGVKEIGDIKSYHMKFTTSGNTIEGDYIFGGICNSKRIGGGVVRFDDEMVNLNDGLLEVFLIKFPKNPAEFTQLVFDLNTGNYESSMIEFFSADKIVVETEDKVDWTVDGEYQCGAETISIHNIKDAFILKM